MAERLNGQVDPADLARMDWEGPAQSLKPGLETAVLPSRGGFPVRGELRLNGSAEAARAGKDARTVFGQVDNQVTHRPPANGVRKGS